MDLFVAFSLSIYSEDGSTTTERVFYDKDIHKSVNISNKYQWTDTPQFTIYNQDCEVTIYDKNAELQRYINHNQIITGDKVKVNLVKRENGQLTTIYEINEYVISDISYKMATDEVTFTLSDELLYNGVDRYFADNNTESIYVESKTGKEWITLLLGKIFPENNKYIVYKNGVSDLLDTIIFPSLLVKNDLATNIIEDFCMTFGLVVYMQNGDVVVDRFEQRRGNEQWQQ